MKEQQRNDKIERVLGIYSKLINGGIVNKTVEATKYGVNERSIQRDIDDIRNYFELESENNGYINSVIYDRAQKGFRLDQIFNLKLTNSEVLAVSKILLDCRAFTKKEMRSILDKLITCCVPKSNRKLVTDLIENEAFHYVELRHKKKFIDDMWLIGQAIRKCQYLEIDYTRLKDKKTVRRKIKPVAIMFSEYYFYLTAFIDEKDEARQDFDVINDSFPTIYRIDRIKKIKALDEQFRIPYANRFEEGEFRKRVQFMFGGRLQRIRFEYSGLDIDAVLDRLPTAKVESEKDGVYTVRAEVFGTGINMWLRSQGDYIKILN